MRHLKNLHWRLTEIVNDGCARCLFTLVGNGFQVDRTPVGQRVETVEGRRVTLFRAKSKIYPSVKVSRYQLRFERFSMPVDEE